MQALIEQVTSYLLGTWVRTTISGQHARELSSQVGQSVYQQSLQNDKTLQTWTTPKSVPTHLVEFLAQRSSVLVDGLWLNQSPGLAEWARLMTKPQSNNGNTDIVLTDLASDGSKPALPYSVSLLDEINQRLQVDFSIDVAGIFEGFAMNVSHAHAH